MAKKSWRKYLVVFQLCEYEEVTVKARSEQEAIDKAENQIGGPYDVVEVYQQDEPEQ